MGSTRAAIPSIRRATSGDIPDIRRLIETSVRGLSTNYYTNAQIESALEHVFGVDTQLIADGTYYVVDAGEIAAAGGWSHRSTLYGGDQAKAEADPELDPATDAARIRAFFVDPRWARRGLARLMFEECLVAARRHGFSRFELAATLPGEPLYISLGFVAEERYSATMPDGNTLPLVRMTRPIATG